VGRRSFYDEVFNCTRNGRRMEYPYVKDSMKDLMAIPKAYKEKVLYLIITILFLEKLNRET
jgi:hypothetical protein